MASRPYISVVIPSWNEEKYIARTLKSLLKQSLDRKEYEIIVVDGHSKDKTRQIAKKYGAKVYLENKGSIGYARNLGAKKARGEIVAFIDADSVAPKNWLMRIKKTFRKSKLVGIGGMAIPINGRFIDHLAYFVANYYMKGSSWLGLYQFIGFNCAYRRKNFLAAGGFNPDIKFMEDSELSMRFRKQGKCKLSRRLKVYTSPRRLVQIGPWKSLEFCAIGYWCMITGQQFPIDYAHSLNKSGKIDH
jgi:glycosyltransferase involved in cell wall biosynthesis